MVGGSGRLGEGGAAKEVSSGLPRFSQEISLRVRQQNRPVEKEIHWDAGQPQKRSSVALLRIGSLGTDRISFLEQRPICGHARRSSVENETCFGGSPVRGGGVLC